MRAPLIVMIVALTISTWAASQPRFALVIGNNKYIAHPLKNPVPDGQSIASELRTDGFNVTEEYDLDFKTLAKSLAEFKRTIIEKGGNSDDVVALIYFAGHGIQVEGVDYLVPVDVDPIDETEIEFGGVSIDKFEEAAEKAGNAVIILDACRDDPYSQPDKARGVRATLLTKPKSILPHTVLAFSARSGQIAADGDGKHSPYAAAILKELRVPGLEIGQFFRHVRTDVLGVTNDSQDPEVDGDMPARDFFFVVENNIEQSGSNSNNISESSELKKVLMANTKELQSFILDNPDNKYTSVAIERLKLLGGGEWARREQRGHGELKNAKSSGDQTGPNS